MILMRLNILIGLILLWPGLLTAAQPPVSNTYVSLEGDIKWKYMSLLTKMDQLVYSGKTTVYANLTEDKKARISSIDSGKSYKEIVRVPDPHYSGSFKDTLLRLEKPLEEWCDGVVFTVRWDDTQMDALQGEIVGFGLSYALNIEGQYLGSYPMFYFKMSALQHFTEYEKEQLKELLEINCQSFTSITRLYAKIDSKPQHRDSTFNFSSFKTPAFFETNRLYIDKTLETRIAEYNDFERLVKATDTLGLEWDSKYMWRYPRWLFTSHLEYYSETKRSESDWSFTVYWRSIGISSHNRNKSPKTFFMSLKTFRDQIVPMHWAQIKGDYLEAVMLGFEHPIR